MVNTKNHPNKFGNDDILFELLLFELLLFELLFELLVLCDGYIFNPKRVLTTVLILALQQGHVLFLFNHAPHLVITKG